MFRRSGSALLPALAALPVTALALQGLTLQLGRLQGPDWGLQALQLEAAGLLDGGPLRLQLATLGLGLPGGPLQGLTLDCGEARLVAAGLYCAELRLQAGHALLGPLRLQGALQLGLDGRVHGTLQGVWRQAQWSLALAGLGAGQGGARLQLRGLAASELLPLAESAQLPGGWTLAGVLDLDLELDLRDRAAPQWALQLRGRDLDFSSPDGSQAGEALGLALSLDWQGDVRQGVGQLGLDLDAGLAYLHPWLIEAGERPLQLAAGLQRAGPELALPALTLSQGATRVQAEATLDLAQGLDLRQLQAELRIGDLAEVFEPYVVPMADGALADLALAGPLDLQLRWNGAGLHMLQARSPGLRLDDAQGRVTAEGLALDLDWQAVGPGRLQLDWDQAQLYALALGPAQWRLASAGSRFALLEAARVPLLGGALAVDRLHFELGAAPSAEADLILTPIDLQALGQALGWPAFGGRLSGVIPRLRYADDQVEIGGMLLAELFDGEVRVRGLRLQRPLGPTPQLVGEIDFQRLDLAALTSAFDFGRIEGRVDGHVHGLELVDWQPVAFDAGLASSPDDDRPHRISQRAIDHITSIGGGGLTDALSRGVMGMFERFRYRQLGWRCRLRDGVCEMGGVAERPEGGYYLVQGGWLPPRIDVISHTRRVDWQGLIQRLQAVRFDQAPTLR